MLVKLTVFVKGEEVEEYYSEFLGAAHNYSLLLIPTCVLIDMNPHLFA